MLLGQGAFGKVMKAEATGIFPYEAKSIVAVKMPRGMCHVLRYGYTYLEPPFYLLLMLTVTLMGRMG